jgi:hypothetical protein
MSEIFIDSSRTRLVKTFEKVTLLCRTIRSFDRSRHHILFVSENAVNFEGTYGVGRVPVFECGTRPLDPSPQMTSKPTHG